MSVPEFVLPEQIQFTLDKIEERGHEAYVVGGCIRDLLMGRVPNDWDVATSALPEQIQEIFKGYNHALDGLKHGTVTVILNHMPVEITTYRIDGDYSDGRRPDAISFTSDLEEDLARRDFTINACAYRPGSFVDPFGCTQDIEQKLIRCVGDPTCRFTEDSLRILRGIRFASELSFSIENSTKDAMLKCTPLLKNISQERISTELLKTLVGDNVADVLIEFQSILLFLIPELKLLANTKTAVSAYSNCCTYTSCIPCFDYLEMLITSISLSEKDLSVRLALLLNGLGEDNIAVAESSMHRMLLPSGVVKRTLNILRYINMPIEPVPSAVKRVLRDIGVDTFRLVLNAKSALSAAVSITSTEHCKKYESINIEKLVNIQHLEEIEKLEEVLSTIVDNNKCYSLSNLDITGKDLINAGLPEGKQIGEMLNLLLDMVIDDRIENNKDSLIRFIHNLL